jgi:hypothetical protein
MNIEQYEFKNILDRDFFLKEERRMGVFQGPSIAYTEPKL